MTQPSSIVLLVAVCAAGLQTSAAVRGTRSNDARYKPQAGDTFICHQGHESIPFSRVNDNYCDCPDGSDEPGTSACPDMKFFCQNQGAVPKQIWSAAVGDGECDCCDGTDEDDGVCSNTCFEEGAAVREALQRSLDEHKQGLAIKQSWVDTATSQKAEAKEKLGTTKSELEQLRLTANELKAAKEEAEKAEEAHKAVLREKEEAEKKLEEEAKKLAEEAAPAAEESTEQPATSAEESTEEPNANERQALALDNKCASKVQLFGGGDFTGWQAKFGVGKYEGMQFVAMGGKDNAASSIKVPPGCVAHVHGNPDFSGWTAVFTTGEYTAGEMGAAGAEELDISSIRVFNEGDDTSLNAAPKPEIVLDPDGAQEEELTQLQKLSCVSWRQTGGCDPHGPPEKEHDKPCAQTVKTGASGYCECEGGVKRNMVPCVHVSFDCRTACEEGKVLAEPPPPPPPPPPPAVTSSNYQDPLAEAARTQHRAAEAKVGDLERSVKDLEATLSAHEYGPESEYLQLKGQCFELRKQQYTYKVCPFANVKQDHTALGNWGSWDDDHTTMHFTGGGSCWQGPARSAKVRLHCGVSTAVLAVDEPERCTYVLDMETPAACSAAGSAKISAELQALSGPALKDEM